MNEKLHQTKRATSSSIVQFILINCANLDRMLQTVDTSNKTEFLDVVIYTINAQFTGGPEARERSGTHAVHHTQMHQVS